LTFTAGPGGAGTTGGAGGAVNIYTGAVGAGGSPSAGALTVKTGGASGTTAISIASGGITTIATQLSPVVVNTDGTETLTAAQSGSIISCTNAGTSTITLPDPSSATIGVTYRILQTVDQAVDIVPTTGDGNSIKADNVLTSDKVSLSTASHKIGAG
jgi:hypothetical protein